MKKSTPAPDPDAYVSALTGWQLATVKRLRKLDERLVASGKYEMATLQIREGDAVRPESVRRLVREAVRLNRTLGDPTRQ